MTVIFPRRFLFFRFWQAGDNNNQTFGRWHIRRSSVQRKLMEASDDEQ